MARNLDLVSGGALGAVKNDQIGFDLISKGADIARVIVNAIPSHIVKIG